MIKQRQQISYYAAQCFKKYLELSYTIFLIQRIFQQLKRTYWVLTQIKKQHNLAKIMNKQNELFFVQNQKNTTNCNLSNSQYNLHLYSDLGQQNNESQSIHPNTNSISRLQSQSLEQNSSRSDENQCQIESRLRLDNKSLQSSQYNAPNNSTDNNSTQNRHQKKNNNSQKPQTQFDFSRQISIDNQRSREEQNFCYQTKNILFQKQLKSMSEKELRKHLKLIFNFISRKKCKFDSYTMSQIQKRIEFFIQLLSKIQNIKIDSNTINQEVKNYPPDMIEVLNSPSKMKNHFQDIKQKCKNLIKQMKSLCELPYQMETKLLLIKKIGIQLTNHKQTIFDSQIIWTKEDEIKIIQVFNLMNLEITQVTLLYRASDDQFQASTFHKKCDGKRNTILIVKTKKKYIFVGYNSKYWGTSNEAQGKYIADKEGQCCLFSVTNKKVFSLSYFNRQKAIQFKQGYGPIFGDDLKILNQANKKKTVVRIGNVYFNSINNENSQASKKKNYGKKREFNEKQELLKQFSGEKNQLIQIQDYEIFQLN